MADGFDITQFEGPKEPASREQALRNPEFRHSQEREYTPAYKTTAAERAVLGIGPNLEFAGGLAGGALGARYGGPVAEAATAGVGAAIGHEIGETAESLYYGEGKSILQRLGDAATTVGMQTMLPMLPAAAKTEGVNAIKAAGNRIFRGKEAREAGELMKDLGIVPEEKAARDGITGRIKDFLGIDVPKTALAPLQMGRGGQQVVELQKRLPYTSGIWHEAIDETQDLIRKQAAKQHKALGGTKSLADATKAVEGGIASTIGELEALAADNYAKVPGIEKFPVDIGSVKGEALAQWRKESMKVPSESRQANMHLLQDILTRGMGPEERAQTVKLLEQYAGRDLPPEFVEKLMLQNSVSFEEARAMRSSLYERARGREVQAPLSRHFGGKVDSAMDSSMARGMAPESYEGFRLGNKFWGEARKAEADADELFRSSTFGQEILRGFSSGSEDVAGKLRFTMKMLSKPEQDAVKSSMFYNLGLETGAAAEGEAREWSAEVFKRKWVMGSKEAKEALYSKEQIAALDKWAKLGGRLEKTGALDEQKGIGYFALGAGLTGVAGATYMLTGDWRGAAMTLMLPASGALSARLMVNPRFVNWLTEGAVPETLTAKGWSKHLTRLASIYTAEPAIRPDLQEYLEEKKKQVPKGEGFDVGQFR